MSRLSQSHDLLIAPTYYMIGGIIIIMAEANQAEVGRVPRQGDQVMPDRDGTVSLLALAQFIRDQDIDIAAQVEALGHEAPNMLAPPAQITEHAGRIGLEAGRRAVLNALSQVFFQGDRGGIASPQERLAS